MKCFVIMPFGDERADPQGARRWRDIFENIRDVIESTSIDGTDDRLHCTRADTELWQGNIMNVVLEGLLTSDLVLADLTGRNPNVYYELGVRHALRGRTIILTQDDLKTLPFDVIGHNTILYSTDFQAFNAMKARLKEVVRQVFTSRPEQDNQVQTFLHHRELQQLADERDKDAVSRSDAEAAQTEHFNRLWRNTLEYSLLSGHPLHPSMSAQSDWIEGAWAAAHDGTTYIIRRVNGQLRGAYSLGLRQELGGTLFDTRIFQDQAWARFQHLAESDSGYVWLAHRSAGRVQGGWWYPRDAPVEFARWSARGWEYVSHAPDDARPGPKDDDVPPLLNPLTLVRLAIPRFLPDWAADYFAQIS
jgi:hypothetical protein